VYLKDSKFCSKIILEHEMHFPVEMLIVFAAWLAKSVRKNELKERRKERKKKS